MSRPYVGLILILTKAIPVNGLFCVVRSTVRSAMAVAAAELLVGLLVDIGGHFSPSKKNVNKNCKTYEWCRVTERVASSAASLSNHNFVTQLSLSSSAFDNFSNSTACRILGLYTATAYV